MSKLGQGAYGSVIKRDKLAVKKFAKLSHIVQEQTALYYLDDCDYVVHTKGVNYDELELSMELYDMSLRKWIATECQCEKCYNHILRDILYGLIELQDRGLSHSDIKPGNILINKKPFKTVLGDCGFVSIAKYSKQQRTAPSHRDLVVENDDKHDMFSFGIILLELLYSVKPSVRETYKEYQFIINKKVKNKNHIHLLRNLLNEDRSLRPCAREVMTLLYHVDPPQWESCYYDVTEIKSNLCKRYTKNKMRELEFLLKNSNINRSPRGYKALLVFLNDNQVDNSDLVYCLIATMIILSSTFSQNSVNIHNIVKLCHVKYNKLKIYNFINTMTTHREFVNIIFS